MSVALCSREHIAALVKYHFRKTPAHAWAHDVDLPEMMATSLMETNERSYEQKYPNEPFEREPPFQRTEIVGAIDLDAVGALKFAQFVEYQCCEVYDWYQTTAFKHIREIVNEAITQLPGYGQVAWGYEAP